MDKPNQNSDQNSDRRIGKVFLIFASICAVVLPIIVLAAFNYEPQETTTAVIATQGDEFDHRGQAVFNSLERMAQDYLAGVSSERNLSAYYDRRQYLGSPPYIPHKGEEARDSQQLLCLTCHAKGGWSAALKRHTPLTPHPQQTACRQCHVQESEIDRLFVANDWKSVAPPRLGRAHLPGAPSPIVHDLQMRGDCMACHVGPAAVAEIRVEHPSRGNCRQCHVPDAHPGLFERKSAS